MSLTLAQRLDRLKARLLELAFWREREVLPIDNWRFNGSPISLGVPWPKAEVPVTFTAAATVPGDWPLEHSRLKLDVGGESLLTLTFGDGQIQSFGLDPYHQEFPLKHRTLSIETQSVPRLPFGEPVRNPIFNTARLIRLEPELDALILLLTQVIEAIQTLHDHEVVPHLTAAAETAFRSLDWPSSTADYIARTAGAPMQQKIWQLPELISNPAGLEDNHRASIIAAHDALVASLKALKARFPPQGEIALTGHAHIDLAWLWPYGETRCKVRCTFHTALSLMEQSPDFRFNQSTGAYYAQLEKDDPALLEAVKEKVADGSWETLGGMWVEPIPTCPLGKASSARSFTASAISKRPSAPATRSAGCPIASAFPARCRNY